MTDPSLHDPMDPVQQALAWIDDAASRSDDPAQVYRNAYKAMLAKPAELSPEMTMRVREAAVGNAEELAHALRRSERKRDWLGTRAALAERALRLLLAGRPADEELEAWRTHVGTEGEAA